MPKKVMKKKNVKAKHSKKGKKAPVTDDEPVDASKTEDDEYDLTKEEYEDKIEKKEADEDVYTEEGREDLLDDDEIDDMEQGFSKGANPGKKRK